MYTSAEGDITLLLLFINTQQLDFFKGIQEITVQEFSKISSLQILFFFYNFWLSYLPVERATLIF